MKPRKIPMRMCVGCREMKEKRGLIRIATGKKSGRGAYVCRNPECLKKAIKQKQLERQLQTDLSDEVKEALVAELERLTTEGNTEA